MLVFLEFGAIIIATTSSCPFYHPYRYPTTPLLLFFYFLDYQQIANAAFLRTEMKKILSLSEHEPSELHNSNTESHEGISFFPINSWPGDIRYLFHKSEFGDTNTFKFILFSFGNNMYPHLLLNFLFIKYRKNPGKIPKRILRIQ